MMRLLLQQHISTLATLLQLWSCAQQSWKLHKVRAALWRSHEVQQQVLHRHSLPPMPCSNLACKAKQLTTGVTSEWAARHHWQLLVTCRLCCCCLGLLTAAEPLPPKDPEIIDWLSDVMEQAAAAATSARSKSGGISSSGSLSFINLNTGYEYSPSLGFFVALDGAARLARLLPTAGLVSYSPPGSLYQVGGRRGSSAGADQSAAGRFVAWEELQ
jgi:hypothetical protein